MITVKFFGFLSIDTNMRQIFVNAGTVREVLSQVKKSCPDIREQQLKQAVLFVNKEHISGNKRFSVVLKDGDELALLSPGSGG